MCVGGAPPTVQKGGGVPRNTRCGRVAPSLVQPYALACRLGGCVAANMIVSC
jgi:hypothetical protein